MQVIYLSDAHIYFPLLVNGKPDVYQVIFMRHAPQLNEGKDVALIKPALIVSSL